MGSAREMTGEKWSFARSAQRLGQLEKQGTGNGEGKRDGKRDGNGSQYFHVSLCPSLDVWVEHAGSKSNSACA